MSSVAETARVSMRRVFARDIAAFIREIEAYPSDAAAWQELPGVTNTAGTLALHLAGNLRHFIGAALGNTGYVRNRDAEFSARAVPRRVLVAELRDAAAAVDRTFAAMDDAMFAGSYPWPVLEKRVPVQAFLVQLAVHLGYHLGQVDYHRRTVTGENSTVNTVSLGELFDHEPPFADAKAMHD